MIGPVDAPYHRAMNELPIVYSFRRCPYAMRARMAMARAGSGARLREVVLRDKPEAMLDVSPKGTVPVLVLPNGEVIDESLDVMIWALSQDDPDSWLADRDNCLAWIERSDHEFKGWLDKYKYANRHPEQTELWYREQGEQFIQAMESQLSNNQWLGGSHCRLCDVAVFPFIRQFAGVDPAWWQSAPYPSTRAWLDRWLKDPLFASVMKKYPQWQPGDQEPLFPDAA